MRLENLVNKRVTRGSRRLFLRVEFDKKNRMISDGSLTFQIKGKEGIPYVLYYGKVRIPGRSPFRVFYVDIPHWRFYFAKTITWQWQGFTTAEGEAMITDKFENLV